jgi:hypothetical protein
MRAKLAEAYRRAAVKAARILGLTVGSARLVWKWYLETSAKEHAL